MRVGGFILVLFGGVFTDVARGSWWLVLGTVVALVGLCCLFTEDV